MGGLIDILIIVQNKKLGVKTELFYCINQSITQEVIYVAKGGRAKLDGIFLSK